MTAWKSVNQEDTTFPSVYAPNASVANAWSLSTLRRRAARGAQSVEHPTLDSAQVVILGS